MQMCDTVTQYDVIESKNKGGATSEAFQKLCFLALIVFVFLTFDFTLTATRTQNTLQEKRLKCTL